MKVVQVQGVPALVQPGVTNMASSQFPVPYVLAAYFRLVVPWADVDKKTPYSFDVVDEQGKSILLPGKTKPFGILGAHKEKMEFPYEENCLVASQVLEMRVPAKGWYSAVMYIDGKEGARSTFRASQMGAEEVAAFQRQVAQKRP